MREVLSVHVGGAGVRLGYACWELYCAELGLALDGSSLSKVDRDDDRATKTSVSQRYIGESKSPETFFKLNSKERYVPRVVFVDNEPSSALEDLKRAPYRDLFDADSMVLMSDANAELKPSSQGRSCYYDLRNSPESRDAIERSIEQIRKLAEDCASKSN